MTTTLPIEVHAGYEIILHLPAGIFRALVEGSPMESATLADLRTRLSTVAERMRMQERAHLEPVSVWLYSPNNHEHTGEVLEIRGIVAGKFYPRKLRTNKGQAEASRASERIIVLHPADSRIPAIMRLFAQHTAARKQLAEIESIVSETLHGLPSLVVPEVRTKEDALNEEPQFLAQLRALQLGEERA